jgi:CheY-like chemotaxis protein
MFHIAFVEDNPSEILLTRVTCEDLGFLEDEKVSFFEDEISLYETLKSKQVTFDLIFLDVNIGNTSGFDVLKKLKKQKIKIPIFMYSNSNNSMDLSRSKMLQAEGYFQKPYDYETMKKMIQTIRTNLNNKTIDLLIAHRYNLLL